MRNMCMTMLTGEHYAECLDRAAKILGGHRQVQLEYPSNWDLWYFPEDKAYLVNLFVPDPNYIFESHCEDATTGYKKLLSKTG